MSYRGYYINLDRSVTRREHVVTQLTQYNLTNDYERFAAANGNVLGVYSNKLNDAEIGCFTSHYLLLKNNVASDQYLHVIEDDAILCKRTHGAIENVIASPNLREYDIIFTDMLVPLDECRTLKKLYNKILSQRIGDKIPFTMIKYGCCTSSYIVKPSSIPRVCDIFEEELQKGPDWPIDMVIRRIGLEGRIRVGCLFPFVTSVLLGDVPENIIRTTLDPMAVLAGNLARASFFIEQDLNKLYEYASRALSPLGGDIHADLLARIYRYALSEKFQPF